MPLSYRNLSQPAAEPISLTEAKLQLVVDPSFSDDDLLISSLIVAARQYCEVIMERSIFNRSMQLNLDFFPFPSYGGTINANDRHCLYGNYWNQIAIRLPKPGCVSVESIKYIDLSSTPQTLDPSLYYVDINSEPARIVPKPGLYWPYTMNYLPGSVTIVYTSGTYGDGVLINTCPRTICQAMLLLVSAWYSNRDAMATTPPKAIEFGVEALLAGEKFDTFGWE